MMNDSPSDVPFLTWREYSLQAYGEVLHRVPIDLGGGCPNRETGGRGCSFCPSDGVRAVQLGAAEGLADQVHAGMDFARRRYGAKAFMAYLQTYTPTHQPIESLRESINTLLSLVPFKALAIGARPDSLTPELLSYLEKLSQRIDLWVELGVQTSHDQTLKRVNRGHDWACSERAVRLLADRKIKAVVHLILGLPGEDRAMMTATVERVAALPFSAVKFHNLHIVRGTVLAEEYEENPFPLLNEVEYTDLLIDLLPRIPAGWPIMRFTTDTEECDLIAPRWTLTKGAFIEYLTTQMRWREASQGRRDEPAGDSDASQRNGVVTGDESITFWSPEFKEHYHSPAGAYSEAREKFVIPSGIETRLADGMDVRLLDVCFGLGYNSLVACESAIRVGRGRLHIIALEMDRRVVGDAARQVRVDSKIMDWNACLESLHRDGEFEQGCVRVEMIWGDARVSVPRLHVERYDAIFLDAFSTQRNSELWTQDFFEDLKQCLKPSGCLLTYCAAIPVRSGLLRAGFHVGETPAFGRERGGTMAAIDPARITLPLPDRDLHLIHETNRGIPYRDPTRCATNKAILRQRQQAIEAEKAGDS
ncbi:MAG: tRNA modification radical SAM protein MnmL/YtqA [Planctomycetota bacterium]|jgi:radical SAM protein (TIGR01212 family)